MKLTICSVIVLILCIFTSMVVRSQGPGDTVDVVKYDIDLSVLNFTSRIINGNTGIEFVVKQPSVQVIPMELKQLQVDSVKNEAGEPLAFSRQGDYLRITLSSPAEPADTTKVNVFYHGVPFSESWGGFHFAGNYAFNLGVGFESIPHNLGKAWFPCVDDFKDRALYDYHITVEAGKKAVCGGLLQSVTENVNGTHTWNWKSFNTIPTYLASVAIGPYAERNEVFNGMLADVPITYYVRPADTNKVAGTFVNMQTIAANYESRFGAYPFSRIGITGTALGAMEHAENIFIPYGSFSGNTGSEWLYAHELSHMWFGDKVTCATDADMWMNEGWARWCEIIYTEDLYGLADADTYFRSLHKDVLQYTHVRDNGYRALSPMDQVYTYGSTVYDKGAVVTNALRHYMGDSLFFQGVKDYLTTYGYNHADSYQLRDALSQSSGIDLTGFFDFYVFNPGFTHYSIDSFHVAPKCGQYQAEVFMKQKLKGTDVYASDCRVDLSFMRADRTIETLQVNFTGIRDTVLVTLGFEPVLVMADLFNHASDATTDQAKTLNSTGIKEYEYTFCKLDVKQVTDSAYVRVTHNWVAPDSLFTPQPGLTLSTNRYWTIEGIFPLGFSATGIFSYNKNIFDADIINNSNDSLVILYRPGAGSDWQPVSFSKVGVWQLGNIYVDNIQPGQYVLAVWDEQYVGYNSLPVKGKLLKIFPNPTEETLTIQTSHSSVSELVIHQADGKKIYSQVISAGEELKWSNLPGTYFISLFDNKKLITSAKAIIQ